MKTKYGDCTICGGRVYSTRVEKICRKQGRLIAVVERVPAGVCNQCGEKYYEAKVLKHIESLLETSPRKPRYINIPLTRYAA